MWRFFRHANWNWNHLLLTGPKKNQRWGKSEFSIFMFIADNSIFKSIMQYFFSAISIALKEFYLMMKFEKNSFYHF